MPRRSKAQTQRLEPREPRRDVNAAVRATHALQLALEGHTYQTIADRAGYASRGAAWTAVQRELRRSIKPAADEVRQMELMRLDALLQVQFAEATTGAPKDRGWATDRVLRIMERRAGLLGLDARPDATNIAATVLIRQYDANTEAV